MIFKVYLPSLMIKIPIYLCEKEAQYSISKQMRYCSTGCQLYCVQAGQRGGRRKRSDGSSFLQRYCLESTREETSHATIQTPGI